MLRVKLDKRVNKKKLGLSESNCVSIDLRKVFDTVNQTSILRAMKRVGLSDHIYAYVGETFKHATTIIKIGNNFSRPIKISTVVKQKDPLSPILFHLVNDERLCDLERLRRGGLPTWRLWFKCFSWWLFVYVLGTLRLGRKEDSICRRLVTTILDVVLDVILEL